MTATETIMTATEIKHNRTDLVFWKKTEKIYTIIKFSCQADINISKKIAGRLITIVH